MPLMVFTLAIMLFEKNTSTLETVILSLILTGVYMIGDRLSRRLR